MTVMPIFLAQVPWPTYCFALGISLAIGCYHSRCEERPPREEECRSGDEPFADNAGECAYVADEGREFEVNGRCTWVICIASDADGKCAFDDLPPDDDVSLRWLRRFAELDEEKNLGLYTTNFSVVDDVCDATIAIDGYCCSKVQFSEFQHVDGGLCRSDTSDR